MRSAGGAEIRFDLNHAREDPGGRRIPAGKFSHCGSVATEIRVRSGGQDLKVMQGLTDWTWGRRKAGIQENFHNSDLHWDEETSDIKRGFCALGREYES